MPELQFSGDLNEWAIFLARILCSAFFSILFIQSGLDKVFNFQAELDWMNPHFSKSFIAGLVRPMLYLLTLIELLAGFGSLAGIGWYFWTGGGELGLASMLICCISIICVFFGQRIAKDYVAAASIVPYFIAGIIGLLAWGF